MTECNINRALVEEFFAAMEALLDEVCDVWRTNVLSTERCPKLTAAVRWWQGLNGVSRSLVRTWTAESPLGRFVVELDRLSDALNVEG